MADIKKIVVIGGGPAGTMAAIRASQLKQHVTLLEKNAGLGMKLLLSGKGRCNITNACELDSFLKRFSKNGQFLRDAFKHFFNKELMDFFEKRGLKLKIERQLRVFPVTDKADNILTVLKKELRKNGVDIIYRAQAKDVLIKDNQVKGVILRDKRVLAAERAIIATGGATYSFTGSTGEGFDIAKKTGHAVVSLRQGLVPLKTRQHYPSFLEGLTLKNIRLRFTDGRKKIESEIGELLFTKSGITGPLVLTLSGRIVDWVKKKGQVCVEIDLKPALSKEQLRARLFREFKTCANMTIKNTLKNLLPGRLIDLYLNLAKIDHGKRVNQITQKERDELLALFKGLRLDIQAAYPLDQAMITRGGVSLKEIDPRTMGSRHVKGLYFAGEILDVDADTGGFNLQAAFSTGYLAGQSAA